jgi:hypothetical protein
MKIYNYAEAQHDFEGILNAAVNQDVIIKKKDGGKFRIMYMRDNADPSPFEVSGIDTDITTKEMLGILKESRAMNGNH